ncbi:MAG: ATP-binding protein, partial [Pirellulaceae bacterium]|nr:ATP-binding protein [Pirellulaceae bacterium]
MQDYEKLGVFYLGREYDLTANQPKDDLVLYDSKDLTTHALCVGMTGSGKTGLCLALLEEAAIDGIPAIIIDPKGDLGNLLLTFPELRPEDFAPYIDPTEATRAGCTPQQHAQKVAAEWKQGLADWGQPPERIARLREAADVAIYTPGSSAGLPLTVLRSFSAPPQSTRDNPEAFRETISAASASLLGLLGIEADPLRSREQILLSSILERTWSEGKDLDLPGL